MYRSDDDYKVIVLDAPSLPCLSCFLLCLVSNNGGPEGCDVQVFGEEIRGLAVITAPKSE